MNALRRSSLFRATSWILTVALIAPLFLMRQQAAHAQTSQALTVIVADFTDRRTKDYSPLSRTATDAIYNELVASGQGRFNAIPSKEVLTEARTLGLRVPSVAGQAARFSATDYIRLAKALNADAIVEGVVNATDTKSRRVASVALDVKVRDVASGEVINGGQSVVRLTPAPGQAADPEELLNKGVSDLGLEVVRQMVQRQLVTATVLNINVDTVILNRGERDGLKIGDRIVILRQGPNGQYIKQGIVKVARSFATDSEAEVESNTGGIRPEDIGRVIYEPQFTLDLKNTAENNVRNSRVNFSSIGKVLTVLGLGVLIAVAIRGGQASVTNVTAAASASQDTPVVVVSYRDNVFGQGNVLQYKVYRDPDFPFITAGNGGGQGNTGSGTGSGTGTGTGTTGTFVSGTPAGTSPPTIREFIDRPLPFNFYANNGYFLTGTSNGGNNTGGTVSSGGNNSGSTGGNTGGTGNTGNSGSGSGGCGVALPGLTRPTGFTPGTSYRYLVTAILLRQQVQTDASGNSGSSGTGLGSGGSSNSGTNGSTSGGNSGTNGGSGNNSGSGSNNTVCIETDPVRSGFATPITPILIDSTSFKVTQQDFRSFGPTFPSRTGADVYQLEISTDRTFANNNLVFRQQIISSAPNAEGVTQSLPTRLDLTQIPQLLADATFNNFVKQSGSGVTPAAPTVYFRVGARNDSDQPGPVDFNNRDQYGNIRNGGGGDRTTRFVYSRAASTQPAALPPPPPGGRQANALKTRLISATRLAGGGRLPLPLPGDRSATSRTTQSLTSNSALNDILSRRGRH